MKKKVLLVAAIAAGIFTSNELNAQDFKPAGGEKNIEVNFTPLSGSPIGMNNLRFRYFASSDIAYRLGFSVSSSSETTPSEVPDGTTTVELEDKSSSFGISINPGIEKHFEGTDRLSPYVGAVLNFSMLNTKDIDQQLDPSTTTGDTYESETTGGSTTFGLNLVLGADWYFSKHIYMGTEVGFGFQSISEKDTETTNSTGPGTDTATQLNGSTFNLGPNVNGAIRLGFLF
ncbi:MAG: hypothetical protein CMC96_09630 [Flavobacteriales bacterium]|nr:hypothetical protein [Flavobacteriales bacterium]|tara:strand:+ start:18083 stop:18772 length:690 start_codon:yes stop_codon:yes gene_type:complete